MAAVQKARRLERAKIVKRLQKKYKLANITASGLDLLIKSAKRWHQAKGWRSKIAFRAAIPLAYLLNKVGAAATGRLGAAVIGRPLLAREIATKEKDSDLRRNLLLWGDLPFVTAEEIKRTPGFDELPDRAGIEKNLQKLHGFRCFSKQEITEVRKMFKQMIHAKSAEHHKLFKRSLAVITEMIDAKHQIMGLAIAEPELTSTVFKEILPLWGIDKTRRHSAIKIIERLHAMPEGNGWGSTLKNLETKEIIKFFLYRVKGTEWHFTKLVLKGKQKGEK